MTARKPRLEARKPPVQQRAKATVDDLLSAAAQVFEAYGYAAGTTNRVAERAGVSIGTLYQYFPSKEALAVALVERHVVDTDRRLHEWVGHVSSEEHGLHAALYDYVTGMMEVHSGRPRLQHILLEETPLPERVHGALLDAERRAAKTMAELLQVYSEIPHTYLVPAGFMVVQAVESLTHRFAAHPDEQVVSRESFVEELVAMLESYLSCSRSGKK
jgi:AcrR family transcriptional regulator